MTGGANGLSAAGGDQAGGGPAAGAAGQQPGQARQRRRGARCSASAGRRRQVGDSWLLTSLNLEQLRPVGALSVCRQMRT